MPATTPPEITRTDLTMPILQLKALGVDDLVKFEWVTNPPAEGVLRALESLIGAGMVGEDGRSGERSDFSPRSLNTQWQIDTRR